MWKKVSNKVSKAVIDTLFQGKPYKGKMLSPHEIIKHLSSRSKRITPSDFQTYNPNYHTFISNTFQSFGEDTQVEYFPFEDAKRGKEDNYALFGLLDGHNGSSSAKFLQNHFVNEFRFNMALQEGHVANSFVNTFVELDEQLISQEKLSGASGIFCYARDDKIIIANSGTSRALLGRYNDQGNNNIEDVVLTNDHIVALEEEKILRKFSHEENIIIDGKIKGYMEHSRGFGDALFKKGGKMMVINTEHYNNWNPPYVEIKPEITEISLNHETDKFIVMATEGLWKNMSNFEVVNIISQALNNGRDPTIDLISNVIEKSARAGQTYEEKLSHTILLSEGFKKMVFQDISIQILQFKNVNEFPPKLYELSEDIIEKFFVNEKGDRNIYKRNDIHDEMFDTHVGPTKESNWIIPDRLLMSAYPYVRPDDDGNCEEGDMKLQSIFDVGIDVFVCLQTNEELVEFERYEQIALEMNPHFIQYKYPIPDMTVPTDIEKIHEFALHIKDLLELNKKVLIHCWGGHGRTGMMISAIISEIYPHLSANEVLNHVQVCHDCRIRESEANSPETNEQVNFVRTYMQRYKKKN